MECPRVERPEHDMSARAAAMTPDLRCRSVSRDEGRPARRQTRAKDARMWPGSGAVWRTVAGEVRTYYLPWSR